MRSIILSALFVVFSFGIVSAQHKKHKEQSSEENSKKTVIATPKDTAKNIAPATSTTLKADDLAFENLVHDFGTVAEGPDATCVFSFKNNGNEPIIIQKASPSCGCTVPSFSGEPVAPGAMGSINVAYHTKGKPNAFSKTITVQSNAGTKVLTIKGNVEKAPTGSVPENQSMLKTN